MPDSKTSMLLPKRSRRKTPFIRGYEWSPALRRENEEALRIRAFMDDPDAQSFAAEMDYMDAVERLPREERARILVRDMMTSMTPGTPAEVRAFTSDPVSELIRRIRTQELLEGQPLRQKPILQQFGSVLGHGYDMVNEGLPPGLAPEDLALMGFGGGAKTLVGGAFTRLGGKAATRKVLKALLRLGKKLEKSVVKKGATKAAEGAVKGFTAAEKEAMKAAFRAEGLTAGEAAAKTKALDSVVTKAVKSAAGGPVKRAWEQLPKSVRWPIKYGGPAGASFYGYGLLDDLRKARAFEREREQAKTTAQDQARTAENLTDVQETLNIPKHLLEAMRAHEKRRYDTLQALLPYLGAKQQANQQISHMFLTQPGFIPVSPDLYGQTGVISRPSSQTIPIQNPSQFVGGYPPATPRRR